MIADVGQKFTPNHTVPVNNVGHYLGPHYVSNGSTFDQFYSIKRIDFPSLIVASFKLEYAERSVVRVFTV